MDLTNPLAVVTPTLDGPVLSALAATTSASTGAHVHRMAGVGSADGVRRVLSRLVGQGMVLAEEHAHATLYRLNRDHLATPWILGLTRMRSQVLELITQSIASWSIPPLHASLYGSFARGEAGATSDVDILLVAAEEGRDETLWAAQIDALERAINAGTGNSAHIVDVTPATLALMANEDDPLMGSWRDDAVPLAGEPLPQLLRQLRLDPTARP